MTIYYKNNQLQTVKTIRVYLYRSMKQKIRGEAVDKFVITDRTIA